MFISLSIENFRSIKDKNTLSFSASSTGKEHLPNHIYNSPEGNFSVLRSVGIYGANASGKSNILLAFEVLRYLAVLSKNLDENERIPCYEPYALSRESLSSPIKIEADFLLDNDIRYTYKVSFDEKRILEESLDFYPNKVKSIVFDRRGNEIKFGGNYKGGKKLVSFFENNTYLSKAGSDASTPQMIRDIYNFFRLNCILLRTSEKFILDHDNLPDDIMDNISKILCNIDTGVKSVSLVEQEVKIPPFLEGKESEEVRNHYIKRNKTKFMFSHEGESGFQAEFEEKYESDGTRKIFSMMGPLLQAFSERHVFIFDEIDNGLHPHIADVLIKLFNDKTINKVGSQLVFTTHNVQIMSPDKMRRDQIFFAEKKEGKTSTYSLDSFDKKQVKTTSDYASLYDEGRFGAIPLINFFKIKDLILKVNGAEEIDQSIFSSDIDETESNVVENRIKD